jgi:integrase/recombinase XerD
MKLVPKAEFSIVTRANKAWIPELVAAAGPEVTESYIDFFTATIRNRNTRQAYARACWQFFDWCAAHGLELTSVRPFHVAAWIEDFPGSKPTIKQKLAAVRMLYDFLVVRQITPSNPAHSVRGPMYVVKKGKTPVWSREDAKTLLDSIPKDSVSGLRDLALIAAMFYSFARVSAVLKLKVDDYYHNGARRRLRFHEKGGKEHEMPVHHLLEQILDEYIVAAGLQSGQPLFQSVNSLGTAVTGRALNRYNAWAAVRKRPRRRVFSPPSDVTPGGRPASRFTLRTMDGSSTPSRWPDTSLREQPSFTTAQRMRLHSVRWNESGCEISMLRYTTGSDR